MVKRNAGIALTITSLVMMLVSTALGVTLTTFSASLASQYSMGESTKIKNAQLLVDPNDNSVRGSILLRYDGGKDLVLDKFFLGGKDIIFADWSYSKVSTDCDDTIPANEPLRIRPSESVLICFIDNDTNISPLDVGSSITLIIFNSVTRVPIYLA